MTPSKKQLLKWQISRKSVPFRCLVLSWEWKPTKPWCEIHQHLLPIWTRSVGTFQCASSPPGPSRFGDSCKHTNGIQKRIKCKKQTIVKVLSKSSSFSFVPPRFHCQQKGQITWYLKRNRPSSESADFWKNTFQMLHPPPNRDAADVTGTSGGGAPD